MKKIIQAIIPDKVELILVAFISFILLIIGNLSSLVQTFSLDDVKQHTNLATVEFLKDSAKSLSDFKISADLATFFVWAIIGLIVFRFGVYLVKSLSYIKNLKDSSKNIFPEHQTYNDFLRRTIVDLMLEVVIISFAAFVFFSSIKVFLPTALYLARPVFIGQFELLEIVYFFAGFLLVFSIIIIIFISLGAYIHRRLLFRFLDEEYNI